MRSGQLTYVCVCIKEDPPRIYGELLFLLRKKDAARKKLSAKNSPLHKTKYDGLRRDTKKMVGEKKKDLAEMLRTVINENLHIRHFISQFVANWSIVHHRQPGQIELAELFLLLSI